MLKNPYINALLAGLYIVLVVFVMTDVIGVDQGPETILIPMTMISLLVLSVAVMWLLFFFNTAKLFFDNQRQEALVFFSKTLGTFAGFVVVFIILNVLVK